MKEVVVAIQSYGQLAEDLRNVPYEPYAPVRQQMLNILRLVNKARKAAKMVPLEPDVLRYRRRIVKPFGAFEPEPYTIDEDIYGDAS